MTTNQRNNLDLGGALANSLQWRLLALWTIGLLLPTAAIGLPFWSLFGDAFGRSPHAGDFARHFDMLAFSDLAAQLARNSATLTGAALVALVLTVVLSPLLSGATLVAAQRPSEPQPAMTLVSGGALFYWRMLRMLLLALLVTGFFVGGIGGVMSAVVGKIEHHATVQSKVDTLRLLTRVLTYVIFVLVHTTVESARARLVTQPEQRSVWRAWFWAVSQLRRQALAQLAGYIVPSLAGAIIAFVLLELRIRMVGATAVGFIAAFVVTQLAVAALGWGRAARLFALSDAAR